MISFNQKLKWILLALYPIYKKEGYLILLIRGDGQANIYRYKSSIIQKKNDRFHGLTTTKNRPSRLIACIYLYLLLK